MAELKFTQEIKDKWLEALKSGEYVQGTTFLKDASYYHIDKVTHCCLGVLCEVHPDMELGSALGKRINTVLGYEDNFLAYTPFRNLLGDKNVKKLVITNDETLDEDLRNYSNVIPIIEKLPVEK